MANDRGNAKRDAARQREEGLTFAFLAVVLAPVLSVALVGGLGLVIWIYQFFAGPPAG